MRQIGRRTGELQSALASRPDIADFAPEPIGPQDIAAWTERLLERSGRTFDLLARQARRPRPKPTRLWSIACWQRATRSPSTSARSLPATIDAVKVRHHGDFHLGQVLVAKDDAFILDFEGEPGRSLAERRRKAPAARDVAGLIRSIDYSTTAALFNAVNLTPEERNILDPKLEIWREKAAEEFWTACRAGRPIRRCGRPMPPRRRTCSISSCSKRRSTKSNTS